MSESTQQPVGDDLSILNEKVSRRVNDYLTHLETEPQADVLTDLQEILVDMISLSTVGYLAIERILEVQENAS